MNKNNFMKAMTMIDEELLQEAGTPDTGAAASEKSEDSFTEYDNETTVSGVDVYHRPVWRKFLAAAAAFVIVAGAVSGGAYCLAQLKEDKKAAEEVKVSSTVTSNITTPTETIQNTTEGTTEKQAESKTYDIIEHLDNSISGKASYEEVEEFLDGLLNSGEQGTFIALEPYHAEYGCIVTDKEKLKKQLLELEWEKGKLNDTMDHSKISGNGFDIGITIDDYGYMYDANKPEPITYHIDIGMRNELYDILNENIEILYDGEEVDKQIIADLFKNSHSAKLYTGYVAFLEGTYSITDTEAFSSEIAALGWVTCTEFECDWGPALSDHSALWTDKSGYRIGEAALGLEGYIHRGWGTNGKTYYYKLKNRNDREKLKQILDKYLVPNKYTELSLKAQNGAASYTTLKARYTYESFTEDPAPDYQSTTVSLKGEMLEDKNGLLYMTGRGKFYSDDIVDIELVEDMTDRSYENYYASYGIIKSSEKNAEGTAAEERYLDICSNYPLMIEYHSYAGVGNLIDYDDSVSPMGYSYTGKETELAFDIKTANGKTECYIHTKSAVEEYEYEKEYNLLFNENWQLLSYEEVRTDETGKHHTIFKLEDPEFDSPDFNNEDAADVYEKLKAEKEKQDKTANNQ